MKKRNTYSSLSQTLLILITITVGTQTTTTSNGFFLFVITQLCRGTFFQRHQPEPKETGLTPQEITLYAHLAQNIQPKDRRITSFVHIVHEQYGTQEPSSLKIEKTIKEFSNKTKIELFGKTINPDLTFSKQEKLPITKLILEKRKGKLTAQCFEIVKER